MRALCEKYDIPYTTGPLYKQYGQVLRTITKLALPNRFTKPNRHDGDRGSRRAPRPSARRRPPDPALRRLGGWTSRATA